MAYRNKTYVVFDADNDIWAYGHMKGWNALPTVNFDSADAHNLGPELTDRASEPTVKRALRQRFSSAKNVVVLIGEKTRNLYRYVRWELEVALQLDLPIIAVNLKGKKEIDYELCPPVVRDEYVVHVPFKLAIIKHALGQFPAQHASRAPGARGPLYYPDKVYQDLGLMPEAVAPPIRRIDPLLAPPVAPNSFHPPNQTISGLLGHLAPPTPTPASLPVRAYSLASLLSPPHIAPPPSGQNLSLADLMRPKTSIPDPLLPWLKKQGE
jgi:hypothetical protein